ncbi:winged helix-turn-helix transcriptional regulator [Flavitalea sp.]|nr:helix-turn-helix domain-containing protein [Flavitalea sp.]
MSQKRHVQQDKSDCKKILKPVRDALDMLSGKWKLPIIIALTFGEKRFTEIAKEVEGITDRMLSRELRDLELNGLVLRKVEDSYPVKVTYALTPYSKTLNEVIESLRKWGVRHRMKVKKDCAELREE